MAGKKRQTWTRTDWVKSVVQTTLDQFAPGNTVKAVYLDAAGVCKIEVIPPQKRSMEGDR
jgi:hypothetical protein